MKPFHLLRLPISILLCLISMASSGLSEDCENGTNARLEVSSIFSDHMVIQRDRPVNVWGGGVPGSELNIRLGQNDYNTKVLDDGTWKIRLPALQAGGPHSLVVSSENETRTFQDVLIGDVWLCSGQSNMAWPVNVGSMQVDNAAVETAQADWPNLRLLTVSRRGSKTPLKDVDTNGWTVCTEETIRPFSAVGYFFGRDIHRHLNVPIGLINSSYGGTMAEAWTSEKGLRTVPDLAEFLDVIRQHPETIDRIRDGFDRDFAAWKRKLDDSDKGYREGKPVWSMPDHDDSIWQTMTLPGYWEDAGHPDLDGLMWFRKEIILPQSWKDKDVYVHFGVVNDRLRAWFNGVEIVNWTASPQPASGFRIPPGIVRQGGNVIAVRVFDMGGRGGLLGGADEFWIRCGSSRETEIPLPGEWKCKVGFSMKDFPSLPRAPLLHPDNHNYPSSHFNAMIAPLTQFPIRGVIWYQGEGNVKRAYAYRSLFQALIQDWRSHWHEEDLPFIFVQLANYLPVKDQPGDDAWAELREAQAMALSLNDTGMAVAIDLGVANDVHPRNKQDVGKRLALAARHVAYGEDIIYSGPKVTGHTIQGHAIRLQFTNVGGGLMVKDGPELRGFAVAGKDRKFVWANAKIEGDSVLVWNDKVLDPVAVRYAWASNPVCNLYNSEELPAIPFRTDDWPCMTRDQTLSSWLSDSLSVTDDSK